MPWKLAASGPDRGRPLPLIAGTPPQAGRSRVSHVRGTCRNGPAALRVRCEVEPRPDPVVPHNVGAHGTFLNNRPATGPGRHTAGRDRHKVRTAKPGNPKEYQPSTPDLLQGTLRKLPAKRSSACSAEFRRGGTFAALTV